MSAEDALHDRGRALEEEYFRRKDRELVERLRRKTETEAATRAMGSTTGITDPDVLRDLLELGFTPETIGLLPLVPVLQVAWAEGGITPRERNLIEKLATARGITPGSPADAQLMDWLANRPAEAMFAGARRLIHALLDAGSAATADLTADDVVAYSEQVAAASGGIFDLGKITFEERTLLDTIAADLKSRRR